MRKENREERQDRRRRKRMRTNLIFSNGEAVCLWVLFFKPTGCERKVAVCVPFSKM